MRALVLQSSYILIILSHRFKGLRITLQIASLRICFDATQQSLHNCKYMNMKAIFAVMNTT